MNLIKSIVTVSELRNGDTVEVNGELETVDRKYLKHDSFMGFTYKGDNHRHGITKVVFKVPLGNGKFRYQ